MDEDPWFVYTLECRDGSLYTGITKDVERRMEMHKAGDGSKYVARKGFSRLRHVILADNQSKAASLEYSIKQLPRRDKIAFFLDHEDLLF